MRRIQEQEALIAEMRASLDEARVVMKQSLEEREKDLRMARLAARLREDQPATDEQAPRSEGTRMSGAVGREVPGVTAPSVSGTPHAGYSAAAPRGRIRPVTYEDVDDALVPLSRPRAYAEPEPRELAPVATAPAAPSPAKPTLGEKFRRFVPFGRGK